MFGFLSSQPNSQGLDMAIGEGNIAWVRRFVLSDGDTSSADGGGYSALMLAVERGMHQDDYPLDIIRLVMKGGSRILDQGTIMRCIIELSGESKANAYLLLAGTIVDSYRASTDKNYVTVRDIYGELCCEDYEEFRLVVQALQAYSLRGGHSSSMTLEGFKAFCHAQPEKFAFDETLFSDLDYSIELINHHKDDIQQKISAIKASMTTLFLVQMTSGLAHLPSELMQKIMFHSLAGEFGGQLIMDIFGNDSKISLPQLLSQEADAASQVGTICRVM